MKASVPVLPVRLPVLRLPSLLQQVLPLQLLLSVPKLLLLQLPPAVQLASVVAAWV